MALTRWLVAAALAAGCNSDPTAVNGPGVLVTPPPVLATSELGEELEFQVVLTGEPDAEVRLPLKVIPAEEGAIEPAELIFTPGNFNQPQTFRVRGVDDEVDDGVRSFTVFLDPLVSSDADYGGLDLGDYELRNYDDEIAVEMFDPGDEPNPPKLLIFEGFIGPGGVPEPLGTSAAIRLSDPPRVGTEVVIELELINAEGDASFDPDDPNKLTASLTFDEDNFADAQIVDIASFDDDFQDTGAPITLVATIVTEDPVYAAVTLDAEAIVQIDDETAGITVNPKQLSMCEGSARVVDVALSTVPEQDDVTVALAPPDNGGLRVSAPVILGGSRLTGQITITADDDDVEQGDRGVTVSTQVTTNDPIYNKLAAGTLMVTVIDNDARDPTEPVDPNEQPLALKPVCPVVSQN